MAANAPANAPANWLFENQNAISGLHRSFHELRTGLKTAHAPYTCSVRIQIFIFIRGKVLLFRSEETGDWTTPSKVVPEIEDRSGWQTVYRIVIKMLKHAIEERTIHNIQFADIATDTKHVNTIWGAEGTAPATKEVPLSIILTADSEALDKNTAVNYPAKYAAVTTWSFDETYRLQLHGFPKERLARMFHQLQRYMENQEIFAANRRSDLLKELCVRAVTIQLDIKIVEYGLIIPYAVILVPRNGPISALFIVDISKQQNDRIHPHGYIFQDVVTRIPAAGGRIVSTQYRIVGRAGFDQKPQFHGMMNWSLLAGVWGQGTRLNIEFVAWSRVINVASFIENSAAGGANSAPQS